MAKFNLEKMRKISKRWNEEFDRKIESDPKLKFSYERKRREIEIALMMRETREKANLTQDEVAELMHTTRSAVSRLEASGIGRHSPSLETILKYANALGYTLKIKLVPMRESGSKTK
ncbi:MAG TPA: helix-turn-helix transcriptional regulator [Gammaproteobacteria bacterium]|nr:helix-turn-helix transcriptional regulator [Gammaproteobacteria bacterium]